MNYSKYKNTVSRRAVEKKRTTVYLDSELRDEAKELKINFSEACEVGLEILIKEEMEKRK